MGEITQLLGEWRSGSRTAENKLFDLVLPELRRLARYMISGERKGHTLQPTDLINQVYFRMVAAKDRDWQNRRHFYAIAGRAMRRHLIDYARGRPNARFEPLEKIQEFLPDDDAKLELAITVDRLLDEMAGVNSEWAAIVEVKYFLGLTDDEAADALGMKLRTMQRTWSDARQWLFERLEIDRAGGASA